MSTNTLPEFIEFGETDEFYPDLEQIEALDLDSSPSALVEADDYGYDLLFDFAAGGLRLSPSGDIKITSTEKAALTVWIGTALASPRGRDLLYSERFGSTLEDLVGSSISDTGLQAAIRRDIEDALLQHDRIVELRDFHYEFNNDYTLITINFVAVTDDATELVFEGLQLGR